MKINANKKTRNAGKTKNGEKSKKWKIKNENDLFSKQIKRKKERGFLQEPRRLKKMILYQKCNKKSCNNWGNKNINPGP